MGMEAGGAMNHPITMWCVYRVGDPLPGRVGFLKQTQTKARHGSKIDSRLF